MHFSATEGRRACKGPDTKYSTGQQTFGVCGPMCPHGSIFSVRRWTWK